MNTTQLSPEEVLAGYDAVSALYPHVPPLSHWRAWELAAYRRHRLDGRVLDLGCGDGRFFRLLWPQALDVVGLDMSRPEADAGERSGVYRKVHVALAHRIPEADTSFDHVFANCSLEHMDDLDAVLAEVRRCLKPGGALLCSVVTDRFVQWSPLPLLVGMAGFANAAESLQRDFVGYHHLANPLSVDGWTQRFRRAGLVPEAHVAIMPCFNTGAFLVMDSLWHVKRAEGGELGDAIFPFLAANPRFPGAFRHMLAGLCAMETDWLDCSGAVFLARRQG